MTLSKHFYLLALGFITISTQQCIAQKEMLFLVKFKPNKTYITNMVNNMQMEMDFDVDSAKKKQMEGTGMKLPMHMNMLQEMTVSTKTGAIAADKRIPMTMTYDKVGITMIMNGKEMKQPDKLVGMKIKAYVTEEGKVNIDTIENNSDAAMKEALQKMISKLFQNVEFPNKAMNIGDTFTQELPMEMPVSGNTLNMLINVTYTLKEIKESQAFFDYTQSISMNFKIEKGNTTGTGSGRGKMIYDIPANYITDTTSDMIMNMNIQVGEMGMKMNLKAKTSVKAKVL
jgi:hypothetical protein